MEDKEHFNEYVRKFFGFSLFLVAVTMPFHILTNSIAIILLSLAWLCEGQFIFKIKLLLQRPLIIIFITFYLLFLLGMLYTSNSEFGKFILEKKLSLIVLPLVIGTSISFNKKMKENVLTVFVFSCFVASLICFGNGLYHYFSTQSCFYLLHEQLSSIISFHPPYFGMYLSFAILIILEHLRKNLFILTRTQKFFLALISFYFFCFIILLSARMALAFLLLFSTIAGTYFFYKQKKLLLWFLVFFSLSGFGIFMMSKSVFLRERVTKLFTTDLSVIDGGKENGLTIRLVKWKCSIQGIIENPLSGTGTGDAVDYLVKCYEKKNFWGMYPQYRYNSHNQYLETTLTLGAPGLICFLLCILMPFISAWRKSQYLLLSFIALFSFCCLTESYLERQQGIVFFTFFISLLSFNKEK